MISPAERAGIERPVSMLNANALYLSRSIQYLTSVSQGTRAQSHFPPDTPKDQQGESKLGKNSWPNYRETTVAHTKHD